MLLRFSFTNILFIPFFLLTLNSFYFYQVSAAIFAIIGMLLVLLLFLIRIDTIKLFEADVLLILFSFFYFFMVTIFIYK